MPGDAPLLLPDGSVRVPGRLARPVLRYLMRDLAEHVRRDGGQPTEGVREVVYALVEAERLHEAQTFAIEPAFDSSVTVEVSAAQAAQVMGCTTQHATRLARSGRIAGRRIGRAWLIDSASVDAWRYRTRKANRGRAKPDP